MIWRLAFLPLLALLVSAAPPRAPRVVSINPCIDAVLVRVADPGQIAAISHYSQDPRATSIPIKLANRFKAVSGTAEEVVALDPDIVLTGPHVAPATVSALKRMGIRLAQYPVPDSVEQSMKQVRDIARQAGHPARGAKLAGLIAKAARPLRVRPVEALVWGDGGLVPGAGTLADALLQRAGFRNMSSVYGLKDWDVLGLEYLIARPPRVLFSVGAAESGHDRVTDHPAARALRRHVDIAPFPDRLLHCGGPAIIEAMGRMKAARRKVGP